VSFGIQLVLVAFSLRRSSLLLYSQIPYIFLECLAKFLVCESLTSNIESRLTLLNFFPTDLDHSFFYFINLVRISQT
jgi:hypothetical protein